MNILWVSDKEGIRGGGSTSERTLLKYMANTDHDLDRIVATSLHGSIIARGPFELRLEIIGNLLKLYLGSRIRRFSKPDVIVSHGKFFPWIGELAKKFGVPHLVFIRDHYYRCPGAMHLPCRASCWSCLTATQRVLWPLVRSQVIRRVRGLSMCDMVITNSNFMKNRLVEFTDKTVNVLYPPVELHNENDPDLGSHDKIVYMGCGSYKGTDLVMKLAKILPHYGFLLAGDPEVPKKWDLREYPNVDWVPWIDRSIAFYQARLMLFPSRWAEPFGRIPVEAGGHGIPTIGSNMGGVPESVGPGGILLDPYSTDKWARWIVNFMENDGVRNAKGWLAKRHSDDFRIDKVGPRFERLLSQLD